MPSLMISNEHYGKVCMQLTVYLRCSHVVTFNLCNVNIVKKHAQFDGDVRVMVYITFVVNVVLFSRVSCCRYIVPTHSQVSAARASW